MSFKPLATKVASVHKYSLHSSTCHMVQSRTTSNGSKTLGLSQSLVSEKVPMGATNKFSKQRGRSMPKGSYFDEHYRNP